MRQTVYRANNFETLRRNVSTRKEMTMTTEYDTRTDSRPETYDPFPEITTFPSGLSLADMLDMVRERPRDSLPVVASQPAPKPGSEPALS